MIILNPWIAGEIILSIQAGDNPRIVKDKLVSFLPPAKRRKVNEHLGDR
jgi:chemotaxis protein MotA